MKIPETARPIPSKRTNLRLCGVVALTLALLAAGIGSAETVLARVSGQVEIGRGEPTTWSFASEGDEIGQNDRVRTGSDGRAEIETPAGTLRVHENSLLRLPPATDTADRVELERGRSLFDVLRRRPGRRFEVQTPTVVVSVKGTQFSVESDQTMGAIEVYHGTVGVRELGADAELETLVREGFMATAGIGIPVEIDVLESTDAWQGWQDLSRAAPPSRISPAQGMGEVDRARATLHQTTAADVLSKAAERRPEIAERLRKVQTAAKAKDGEDANPGPPAALADSGEMHSDPSARDQWKKRFDREARQGLTSRIKDENRIEQQRRLIQPDLVYLEESAEITDLIDAEEVLEDLTFPDGSTNFDLEGIQTLDPETLTQLIMAMSEIESQVADGSVSFADGGEFLTFLENELIALGVDPSEADSIIQQLTNSGSTGVP